MEGSGHKQLLAAAQEDVVYFGQDDGGICFQLVAGAVGVEGDLAAVFHYRVNIAVCIAVVILIFNERGGESRFLHVIRDLCTEGIQYEGDDFYSGDATAGMLPAPGCIIIDEAHERTSERVTLLEDTLKLAFKITSPPLP